MIDIFLELDNREEVRVMHLDGMTESELLHRSRIIKGYIKNEKVRNIECIKDPFRIFKKERQNRWINWDAYIFDEGYDPWNSIEEFIASVEIAKRFEGRLEQIEKRRIANLNSKKLFESDDFYSINPDEDRGMRGYYGPKMQDVSE